MEALKITLDRYTLLLNGSIGVGKSTIFAMVMDLLSKLDCIKFEPIYEFIDDPVEKENGQLMLAAYLKSDMEYHKTVQAGKTADYGDYTFQHYIQLYNQRRQTEVSMMKSDKPIVTVLERGLSDSLCIFCYLAHKRGRLNELHYAMLWETCRLVDQCTDFPCFLIKNFEFSLIHNENVDKTCSDIIEIIKSDLANGVSKRVIGLWATPEDCIKRIAARGRPGEIEVYNTFRTERYCRYYMHLFKMFQDPSVKHIQMTDLGKLDLDIDWREYGAECADGYAKERVRTGSIEELFE